MLTSVIRNIDLSFLLNRILERKRRTTVRTVSFLSSDGKHKVHVRQWIPDSGNIRGILQLIHGMAEHIERYADFAAFLNRHDMLVVGHDQLGHGHTAAGEEELG